MMTKTETIEEFYKHKFNGTSQNNENHIGQFNVVRLEDCVSPGNRAIQYSRRDFYKISLMRGNHVFHYADKSLEVSGTTLMFFNPTVPYTYERKSDTSTGYFCIFKDEFFTEQIRGGIRELPMFAPGNKPSYVLSNEQDQYISSVFERMLEEINSNYVFKFDLIRNYIMEMVHYALKMEPNETLYQHIDANARITAIFSELLERQFPIENPTQRFEMRSARNFADRLSVHVNHLNRAIRETTGKTTTDHIFERVASEAKALLKHTNWNISEISYCLGFEDPAHFNHFFKKQTSMTPSSFRE